MFRALEVRNYRLYFGGQVLSNAGTWMQRVAQDWLVLDLSGSSGVALGITTGLQFLPYLLFSLWGGTLADRIPRRKLLVVTQAVMGLLAILLGVLALAGLATVGIVYLMAFALGVASAFDNPARQAFVNEIVGKDSLPNAIALNSASFNLARLVGPALAGVLVAVLGSGWVFVLNGLSFAVTIAALLAMRTSELRPQRRQEGSVRLRQGLAYVRRNSDMVLALCLAFVVATFGLNYQMTMALMARLEYGVGAEAFGLMSTALALGALAGSLLAARRVHVPLRLVVASAVVFGCVEIVVGFAPTYASILLLLPFAGITAMTFTTSVQTYLQSRSEGWVRGRVMGIYTLVFFGGTPIGAPVIGWAAEAFGPRSGLIGGGVLTAFFSALAAVVYRRHRRARGSGAEIVGEPGTVVRVDARTVLDPVAQPPTTPI
ncbi:MFS transporter [Longivirga aurantiaca]|uniref:MFS transporter n=1 Tax=Longivirga aurantiaca TaxID=1837743 RepID=A0ABW1T5H8_9ACTN